MKGNKANDLPRMMGNDTYYKARIICSKLSLKFKKRITMKYFITEAVKYFMARGEKPLEIYFKNKGGDNNAKKKKN